METNRLWHEPEVVIYGCLITPGISCSGQAYDLANRRWYQVNVNTGVYDEEWMSETVERFISSHYHSSGMQIPFNVINAHSLDGPFEFETRSDEVVARQIREELFFSSKGSIAIPAIDVDELEEKLYMGRAVDRCRWRGQDCVFKRIEFDCDVRSLEREIQSRETLLELLALASPGQTIEAANKVLEERFNVVPIIGVVVDVQRNQRALGILMPYGGQSLEALVETPGPAGTIVSTAQSPPNPVIISKSQLRDLTCGVGELAQAGVVHGDINDRNTLWKAHTGGGLEGNRLVLVDFGETAPDYTSDAHALGELFLWCQEMCLFGVHLQLDQQMAIEKAAKVLKHDGDFKAAVRILEGGEG